MNNQFITWMLLIILMLQVGEVFDLNNRLTNLANPAGMATATAMPAVPATTPEAAMPTATTAGAPVYAECTWENLFKDSFVSPECNDALQYDNLRDLEKGREEEVGRIVNLYDFNKCNGSSCLVFRFIDPDGYPERVEYLNTNVQLSDFVIIPPIEGEVLTIQCRNQNMLEIPVGPVGTNRVQIIFASCSRYKRIESDTPWAAMDWFQP